MNINGCCSKLHCIVGIVGICELPRHDNNIVNQFVLTRLLVCDELIQNLHDQE